MASRKRCSALGEFHKDAAARGLTYAEAQETCRQAGKVRAPKGKLPDGRVYSKISERGRAASTSPHTQG